MSHNNKHLIRSKIWFSETSRWHKKNALKNCRINPGSGRFIYLCLLNKSWVWSWKKGNSKSFWIWVILGIIHDHVFDKWLVGFIKDQQFLLFHRIWNHLGRISLSQNPDVNIFQFWAKNLRQKIGRFLSSAGFGGFPAIFHVFGQQRMPRQHVTRDRVEQTPG